MRRPPRRQGRSGGLFATSLALALAACAPTNPVDFDDGQGGSIGSTGSGGDSATGGLTGTGGNRATGGSPATGGLTGSGGLTATGGARGGSTGTGGLTGSGGAGAGGARGGTSGTGGIKATGGVSGGGGAKGGGTGSGGTAGATTGGGGACMAGPMPTGGKTVNGSGTASTGYTYNFYTAGGGSASMTVYGVDAEFGATWSNPSDFLARVGLGWNSTKTYDQLGTVTADFAETKSGSGGSWNYIGIYGWSENPLHEYYIVEDWFGGHPNPGTKKGTITVDGAMYDVYTHQQNNQPSIIGGNQTFTQYYSVRQTAHSCGHITISDHFAAWDKLGMTLGKMEEARITIEVGGGGSGNITFTNATMSASGM